MDISSGKNSECVKVVVRCRPPNKKEINENRKSIISMNTETGYVEILNPKDEGVNNKKGFTFDAVYDKDSTQRMVYDETAFPLVESVLEGFNGTIFAYGQTGCGKTWTMSGMEDPEPEKLPEEERGQLRGIIPNSFEHIFSTINLKNSSGGSTNGCEFLVRASYLEIYNEEIRDLMSNDPKKKLDIKESPDKGVYVKDLMYEVVENKEQIDRVLEKGTSNRTVGETLMNNVSSRSHSIFGIVIEVNEFDENGENHFRMGKLNLVDLAGSERQSKTGASGDRLKEGCKINLSLSALGNVISALVDGRGKHIPYRDSKLTRLLQDSLGGNTKTVMISAISPADYNYEETISTLKYANRAKNIKNKPVINEDPKDALLREYKDEIEQLKQLLQQQQINGTGLPQTPTSEQAPTKTTIKEKVVQVEKVVEKEIPDKKIVAENRALQDYSEAVVEQRNRLGEELDRKEEEIERQRRERLLLEEKLQRLQKHVLGKETGDGNNDKGTKKKVMEAKKQREFRKAQIKLKQQQRKEAELKEAKRRAEEEKLLFEEECKNAQGVAEAKEKALRALKKTMIAKMDRVRAEMRELEHEFQEERESLLETIREQTREIKRLDQVVDMFLPATERSKLWELAVWNEDDGEWKLPKLKPRKGFKPLQLPGLGNNNSQNGDGGAEVVMAESPSKKSRKKNKKERKNSKSSSSSSSSSSSGSFKLDDDEDMDDPLLSSEQKDEDLLDDPMSYKKKKRNKQKHKENPKNNNEIQWPTHDLPVEDGAAVSMYGDRCQSRQGRRGNPGNDFNNGGGAARIPRQLKPL